MRTGRPRTLLMLNADQRQRLDSLAASPQLEAAIREFIDAHHADPKLFVWTKTADEILARNARFAQRTLDA